MQGPSSCARSRSVYEVCATALVLLLRIPHFSVDNASIGKPREFSIRIDARREALGRGQFCDRGDHYHWVENRRRITTESLGGRNVGCRMTWGSGFA